MKLDNRYLQIDEEIVLWVGATTYYLGRMTYAVSDFCRLLIEVWPQLAPQTRDIIRARVNEAFDSYERVGPDSTVLGMACDVKQWEHVRELWSIP